VGVVEHFRVFGLLRRDPLALPAAAGQNGLIHGRFQLIVLFGFRL
jgi:hypothetical protein